MEVMHRYLAFVLYPRSSAQSAVSNAVFRFKREHTTTETSAGAGEEEQMLALGAEIYPFE